MITITMTLDAERRFIRSLKVDEWHRSYYPEDITTRHNIETREILFISETAQQYTAEVRGTALQPVLKRLDYSSVNEWHSNGPSWRREEFSLLPGYTVTPDSYLRITLLK